MDSKLHEQLKRDEGCKLDAYRDDHGHWTIGVGHLIDLDPDRKIAVPRITRITMAEADAFLEADIELATQAAVNVFGLDAPRFLIGPRWRALLNMAFNRGETNMRESTTITPAIKRALVILGTPKDPHLEGHWEVDAWTAVSRTVLASPWGKQIKERGVRLARQFEIGVDQ